MAEDGIPPCRIEVNKKPPPAVYHDCLVKASDSDLSEDEEYVSQFAEYYDAGPQGKRHGVAAKPKKENKQPPKRGKTVMERLYTDEAEDGITGKKDAAGTLKADDIISTAEEDRVLEEMRRNTLKMRRIAKRQRLRGESK